MGVRDDLGKRRPSRRAQSLKAGDLGLDRHTVLGDGVNDECTVHGDRLGGPQRCRLTEVGSLIDPLQRLRPQPRGVGIEA